MQAYLLFFSHTPQIQWYGLIAKKIKDHLNVNIVLWVVGERDRVCAESTENFDRVVDILNGISSSTKAKDELLVNLEYLRAFEKQYSDELFYHEDVAIDRYIANRGWPPERIAQYGSHLLKKMRNEIDSMGGLPWAAFGEANTLPYRLAHRLLGDVVPYWNFASVRHWEHRSFLDLNGSEQWDKCRYLYKGFREKGVPEPVKGLAYNRLRDLRSFQIQPFASSRENRGGDEIRLKLKWTRVKRVLSDWIQEIRSKESIANPQAQTAIELSPINKVKLTFMDVLRKRYFEKHTKSQMINNITYASYFLHFQPEYTVEGLAFEYRDQATLIENIAAFLPANWCLVVKEHSPMVGIRKISFYKRLMRIPNVILLSDRVRSYELIKRSKIVFTLTGTAALEAMYEGIPAIVFGDVYFDNFEGIYKVTSIRDLKRMISNILKIDNSGASMDAAVAALAAMYDASSHGKIGGEYSMKEMAEPENIRSIADAVIEELNHIDLRTTNVKAGKD